MPLYSSVNNFSKIASSVYIYISSLSLPNIILKFLPTCLLYFSSQSTLHYFVSFTFCIWASLKYYCERRTLNLIPIDNQTCMVVNNYCCCPTSFSTVYSTCVIPCMCVVNSCYVRAVRDEYLLVTADSSYPLFKMLLQTT